MSAQNRIVTGAFTPLTVFPVAFSSSTVRMQSRHRTRPYVCQRTDCVRFRG